jgi:hypothetical protein
LQDNKAAIIKGLSSITPKKGLHRSGLGGDKQRQKLKLAIKHLEAGTEHKMTRTDVRKLGEMLKELSKKNLAAEKAAKHKPHKPSYRERMAREKEEAGLQSSSTASGLAGPQSMGAAGRSSGNAPQGAVGSIFDTLNKGSSRITPPSAPRSTPKPPSIPLQPHF